MKGPTSLYFCVLATVISVILFGPNLLCNAQTNCSYAFNPATATVPYSGQGSISVVASSAACSYTLFNELGEINFSGFGIKSGSGNETFPFYISAGSNGNYQSYIAVGTLGNIQNFGPVYAYNIAAFSGNVAFFPITVPAEPFGATDVTSAPLVTTLAVPDFTVGQAYSPFQLQATGGTPPYTWSCLNCSTPVNNSAGGQSGPLTVTSDGQLIAQPNYVFGAGGVPQYPVFYNIKLYINDSASSSAGNFAYITLPYRSYPAAPTPPPPTGPTASWQFKGTGNPIDQPGACQCGNPISIGNGNKYQHVVDYQMAGTDTLVFERSYNSLGNTGSLAITLGTKWRSNFDRFLRMPSSTAVTVERGDGQEVNFNLSGNTWVPDSDVDMTLVQSGNTWVLKDKTDTVETYLAASSNAAYLQSITSRNGYTQTLTRNSDQTLATVTDSFNRTLNFTYQNGRIQTVTTPDNTTLTFAYSAAGTSYVLSSVSYSTTPVTSVQYVYENSSLPTFLTGIIDENGNRYATWTYDASGRAKSSQHAGGADLTTVVYNDANSSRQVTNALGMTDTYSFTTLQGVPKVTQIGRAATSTTAAATEIFTYDNNGYLESKTDWNGNLTTYINDSHGQPTTIIEASGSSVARTTTITYHPTFHLPTEIVRSGLTTDYQYDSATGNLLTKTETDTTTSTVPYPTNGQKRVWTNTWNAYGLLDTTTGPRTDLTAQTSYTYDTNGAVNSIKNGLKQTVQITNTPGGRPQTIVDANKVTTKLTYDGRQRMTSRAVTTAAGVLTTQWNRDLAGNLTSTILPDNSSLTNTYDQAHRVTKTTDSLGNWIQYTLDALGDRTQSSIYKVGTTTPVWQSASTPDALGRELTRTTGTSSTAPTVTKSYDPDGNLQTVQDGVGNLTTNTYDALNRLASSIDANKGVTTPTFDTNNLPVNVQDANGNSTAYVRDGFGDVIQQTSPDSGVTIAHYDNDGNMVSKTDANGTVTNQTFDAVDRPLTTMYPADVAENVTYTYDQTDAAYGFGIGHLTSVTDAVGSEKRQYDERGNLLSKQRVNGSSTQTVSYTYDAASRVSTETKPDGLVATTTRDAAGYPSGLTITMPGATSTTNIATITHKPFGPMDSASFGNGITESWTFDDSYRPSSIVDSLSGSNLQNLAYGYDQANDVRTITDGVNVANNQTLDYDMLNRLKDATSGAGGYGSLSWQYDNVGNRKIQVQNGTTANYSYTPGTNRLSGVTYTVKAQLHKPLLLPLNGNRAAYAFASHPSKVKPPQTGPPTAAEKSSTAFAYALGWPLLIFGIAGIGGFRKRLISQRLLGLIVVVSLLTGGTLLIGCAGKGSGSGGTGPSTPTTPTTATPTFSPAAGTFTTTETVSINDATSGATIYYTLDGTTPSTSSTKYTAPISVSSTTTIQAIAVASGNNNSAVASATYTINLPAAATPTFSPLSGTFTTVPPVTISDATTGATIYYTVDGTTPTTSSTQYAAPINVSSTETIKAIAIASGYSTSAVASATYSINVCAILTNPAGNIYQILSADGSSCLTYTYNNAVAPRKSPAAAWQQHTFTIGPGSATARLRAVCHPRFTPMGKTARS